MGSCAAGGGAESGAAPPLFTDYTSFAFTEKQFRRHTSVLGRAGRALMDFSLLQTNCKAT